MALLHIAEPDTPDTHNVVGIDLGTTNSLIAFVREGTVVVAGEENADALLPSLVTFSQQGVLVGNKAQIEDKENTFVSIKRYMGLDASIVKQHETRIDRQGKVVRFISRQGKHTAQEISAHILAELKNKVRKHVAHIDGAVITVPAYFDDRQRQATKDAARFAGIPLMRLINEPTAAALAYGLEKQQQGIIAVYDFGGGTFDVSILQLKKGVFQVLATAGDTWLGGDDIDSNIVHWCQQEYGVHIDRQQARTIKESFTTQQTVKIANGNKAVLQREKFNSRIQPLVDRTIDLCLQAVSDANIQPSVIQHLVMVGGSTRIGLVKRSLQKAFPTSAIYNQMNPDTTVVAGAALHAHMLSGKEKKTLLLDVLPLSLGLEMMGSVVERIIPRNTTIPVAKSQTFTTWQDGQTSILIHVVQGERDTVEHCRSLARLELKGLPPRAAGALKITVTFTIDADAILHVHAQEDSSGIHADMHVQPSSGLSDNDIAAILDDSWKHSQQDVRIRSNRQATVEAQRVLRSTQKALAEDSQLLAKDEHRAITQTTSMLENILLTEADNTAKIQQLTEQLIQSTGEFAKKRMDNAIEQVLNGRSVD